MSGKKSGKNRIASDQNMMRLLKIFLAFVLINSIYCSALKRNEFISIFNGVSLDGWQGDTTYWRVENGSLVGEITPQTLLQRNSFITWTKGITSDFELKLDCRISNSG